jgi:hypothetical protein
MLRAPLQVFNEIREKTDAGTDWNWTRNWDSGTPVKEWGKTKAKTRQGGVEFYDGFFCIYSMAL